MEPGWLSPVGVGKRCRSQVRAVLGYRVPTAFQGVPLLRLQPSDLLSPDPISWEDEQTLEGRVCTAWGVGSDVTAHGGSVVASVT